MRTSALLRTHHIAKSKTTNISVVVLTLVPNGGAITKALETLNYTPYRFEDSFSHGRALTHPQQWLSILEGRTAFDGSFLRRTTSKIELPHYDALVGPPSTLAFENILKTCPLSTRIVLVEERDKEAWAHDMEVILSTVSNYRNHKGPAFTLYQMLHLMLDFYKCSAAQRRASSSLSGTRSTVEHLSAERLASSLEVFEDYVKAAVPADRLLVYRNEDGWEPLCSFLDVEVPRNSHDGSLLPFPPHDNGIDAFFKIRDALSTSQKVTFMIMLVSISLLWYISTCAVSNFRQEMKYYYYFIRKRFEPYMKPETDVEASSASVGEPEEEGPTTIGFHKAMVLAKKSTLEYGEEILKK